MIMNKKLCVLFTWVCVALGVNETCHAATAEVIADLQNGTITLPEAIELWTGSFAEYGQCEVLGTDNNCFKALIDPDGIVDGEFTVEFDTGTVFGPTDVGQFSALQEDALIPVDFFDNSFVGTDPTLTMGVGATAIRRTIAFDVNLSTVPAGPQTIARYELFDGEIAQSLPGFAPASFVQAETLNIFDNTTELVFTLTPQRVSAVIDGVEIEFKVNPPGALDDLFRKTELPITVVPEPSGTLLIFMGLLGVLMLRRPDHRRPS